MLTVEADPAGVEKRLTDGEIICPECGNVLRPWGWGVERVLRGPHGARVRLRPRRSHCINCRATHVLLPVIALLRRADAAAVIGAALVAKAHGAGHRTIAAVLGCPAETVRGWLRAFARAAEEIRMYFTVLLAGVDPDPPVPAAAGSMLAAAVAAVLAATAAVGRRWPKLGTVSPWTLACAATNGQLIFPSGPRSSINTSRLWEHLM